MRASAWTLRVGGVEPDCDRASVDQMNLHHRAKAARRHGNAITAQDRAKLIDQWNSQIWRCRLNKGWTTTLARIGEERKLRHDQRRAADFKE